MIRDPQISSDIFVSVIDISKKDVETKHVERLYKGFGQHSSLSALCPLIISANKLLAETYPANFATWLLGKTPASIEVLKTELSIEPIRADSITFLGTSDRILHLEFQLKLTSDPPLTIDLVTVWLNACNSAIASYEQESDRPAANFTPLL